jgi:hypothetical protein
MKLEGNTIWKDAAEVAEYANSIVGLFSEDEKWTYVSKLRNRSFDLTSDIAEALGSVDPRDKTWAFGIARRDAFGLKNALVMAHKTTAVDVDMNMLVKLESITDRLDASIAENDKAIDAYLQKFSPKEVKK